MDLFFKNVNHLFRKFLNLLIFPDIKHYDFALLPFLAEDQTLFLMFLLVYKVKKFINGNSVQKLHQPAICNFFCLHVVCSKSEKLAEVY